MALFRPEFALEQYYVDSFLLYGDSTMWSLLIISINVYSFKDVNVGNIHKLEYLMELF